MSARYRLATYAWEAVYAADFTLEQLRRRSLSVADRLIERGWSCLVAYDTRFMGNLFARTISTDLAARGVLTRLAAAPTPLPAVHHALEHKMADCALIVSARNRPYYANGLVLLAPAAGLNLDLSEEELPEQLFPPLSETAPSEQQPDLRTNYLDALRSTIDLELIRRVSMTIFVDAMSGTSAGIVPQLLGEGTQTRAIEINREPDPLFARITPRPIEAGLNRLKKLVRESDSHLGLAISADGTALAVVDKSGEQLDPTETALLLTAYLSRHHRHKGIVVVPQPAANSPLANARFQAWEDAHGLKIEFSADPDARIGSLFDLERPNLLLGANAEGEITIGRLAGYPDASLAGLMIAEMVARSGGSLRAMIDAQREQVKA